MQYPLILSQDEADRMAKRLWGPKAMASINATNGFFDLLRDDSEGDAHMWLLIGWGHTWNEAFETARERGYNSDQSPAK